MQKKELKMDENTEVNYLENIAKIPTEKAVTLQVISFSWGKANNLIVWCVEPQTRIKFYFSVFNNHNYSSKIDKFNFKEFKDTIFPKKDMISAYFKRTKSGHLDCIGAKLI